MTVRTGSAIFGGLLARGDVLLVLGKGRRERTLPFGRKAGEALDRYLRARARHKDAELPWLWLGKKGRLTEWGLVMMLRRRGAQAGLPGLHPHQFRHTFAHQWLAQGGTETDLMRIAGWKSRAMLQRYGASAADARAVKPTAACRLRTGCRQILTVAELLEGKGVDHPPAREVNVIFKRAPTVARLGPSFRSTDRAAPCRRSPCPG